jgi:hypothetical protein
LAEGSHRVDLHQSASSHEVHNPQTAQGDVTSGRTALAEPLQLLGTCTVPVLAALHDDETRLRVQGWVADEPSQPEKQNYEAMNCLACGGVHFVNPLSGKTINEEVLYQKS